MFADTYRVRLGAAALAGVLAVACGGGNQPAAGQSPSSRQPVTITFANWAAAETATRPGVEQALQDFQAANPGITVTSLPIAFSEIGHQLLLQNTSGNPPDVAELAGNDTAALAEAGALARLEGLLGKSFQDSLLGPEKALGQYSGHLQAVPWTVAPMGFWYNRSLMAQAGLDPAKPPASLDELVTDMAAIKAKLPGVIPLGFDTTNRTFGLDVNWPLMQDFGARAIENGKANANTPAMNQYLDFVRKLGSAGYTVPNQKIGYFRPLAAQGKVAFTFDGPYIQGVIQSTNHQPDADFYKTWGIAAFPAGSSGKHYSMPTDHQLTVFKKSAHQAAAARLVEWLAGSQQAISGYTFKYESSLPPLKNAATGFPTQMASPVYTAFEEKVVPTVVRPPWGSAYSAGYSTIMSGVQEAIAGNKPISQIASTMQSELQTKLNS